MQGIGLNLNMQIMFLDDNNEVKRGCGRCDTKKKNCMECDINDLCNDKQKGKS